MTTATLALPRRPFILGEGEQLLVSRDPLVAAARLVEFVAETGIEPERLVADPVTALPIPIHFRGKTFDDVHPYALWNPLFWLPEDVALRVRIQENETSEPRTETDAEWALRICIELGTTGLYDPTTGWVDVLALHGINVDDPADLEAIQAWQAGLPDERLDAIDLRQYVNFTTDNQAFHDAQELAPLVMAAQWGYTAAGILVAIEADPDNVSTYAALATEMLSAEPSEAYETLEEALTELEAGSDKTLSVERITAALSQVVTDYANAIYELEKL